MRRLYSFFKEKFDAIFLVVSVLVMLTVLVVNLLALHNNMTFADEAWYLCFLRDLPRVGASRSHLLFNNVFNNNIYAIRIACWLFQLIGSVVFAIGVFFLIAPYCNGLKYPKWAFFMLALSSIYWGQMYVVACPSFNNITLNKIFVEMGMGFLFLGMSNKRTIWYLLSGFFVAFLFPTMITNVIIIPIMFIVIVVLSDRKWRDGLGFIIGIALFAMYYFVFVESPREVLSFIAANTHNTISRGGEEYGVKYLIFSLMNAALYLSKCFIVAAVIYGIDFILLKESPQVRKVNVLLAVIVSMVVLLYSWMYIQPNHTHFPYKYGYFYYWQMDLFWILLFMMVCHIVLNRRKIQKLEMMLGVLMLLTPICLCFGSNIPFVFRGVTYLAFISPMLVFFCIRKSMLWKVAMGAVLGLNLILFLVSIDSRNWEGQKYFGGHIPVESIGIHQNIRLEDRWIKELIECRNHIPQGRLLCSCCNWGVVYLLDYVPVCYEFSPLRNGQEAFKQIVDDEILKEGELWIVSYDWETDFMEAIDALMESNEYDIETDTFGLSVYTHVMKKADFLNDDCFDGEEFVN